MTANTNDRESKAVPAVARVVVKDALRKATRRGSARRQIQTMMMHQSWWEDGLRPALRLTKDKHANNEDHCSQYTIKNGDGLVDIMH